MIDCRFGLIQHGLEFQEVVEQAYCELIEPTVTAQSIAERARQNTGKVRRSPQFEEMLPQQERRVEAAPSIAAIAA